MIMIISGGTAHNTDTLPSIAESQTLPTILFVNTDLDFLEELKERFNVRVASDEFSALEELRRAVPAAIVVDIDGQRSSGAAFAEELRDWGFSLVLTTSSRDRPVIAGAEYLEKPFDTTELTTTLMRAIERSETQPSPPARVVRRRVLSG